MGNNSPFRAMQEFPQRVLRYALRRINGFFWLGCVLVGAVPALLFRRVIRWPFKLVQGHGVVLVMSADVVVKVASAKDTALIKEYENALRLGSSSPEAWTCAPAYTLQRKALFVYLICERYEPVPMPEVVKYAVEVRKKLDLIKPEGGPLDLESHPQMQAGLRIVQRQRGSSMARQLGSVARIFLEQGNYRRGLCHGDFHSRNIMRDERGSPRVIDLDCVRFNGIVELDAMHFALEMEWSQSNALWLDTLVTAFAFDGVNIQPQMSPFSVQWSKDLGVVYFLDRIGQEDINYGFQYRKSVIERVLSTLCQT
jgi:hypothetical protein